MCWYLARGGRGGRDHKTHRVSAFPATLLLLRLPHVGFHTPGVPRSVRGVNMMFTKEFNCLFWLNWAATINSLRN